MRLYETTSTVRQKDACVLQQYAFVQRTMKTMYIMAIVMIGMGIAFCVPSIQHSLEASVLSILLFAFAAVVMIPVAKWSAKRNAANMYPGGDAEWCITTWFENDGIHTSDDDDEDDVIPLSRLVCAYRAGNLLLLGTEHQSVVPVNLAQLSETDRKSLFERLKTECPKLKMLQKK